MPSIEIKDDVHQMAYQQMWGETFPERPFPGLDQSGRLGYMLTASPHQVSVYAAALDRYGYTRGPILWS